MAFAFRAVAPALNTLLGQLNAVAPKRSKLSDGALGNAAHAATVSFHNPNSAGIVQARDFTHDPGGGLDCNWLAAALIASGDPRIHELIWNRRYWTPARGWVPYLGTNPHDKHLHLTVRSDPALYNSTAPWDLGALSEEFTVAQYDDLMRAIGENHQSMARLCYVILDGVNKIAASINGDLSDGKDRPAEIWENDKLTQSQIAALPTVGQLAALQAALSERIAEIGGTFPAGTAPAPGVPASFPTVEEIVGSLLAAQGAALVQASKGDGGPATVAAKLADDHA